MVKASQLALQLSVLGYPSVKLGKSATLFPHMLPSVPWEGANARCINLLSVHLPTGIYAITDIEDGIIHFY